MNIGDRIPENLGIDQNGQPIVASAYRGRKFILYSYPKANTSGCTAEACSLQQHKAELEAALSTANAMLKELKAKVAAEEARLQVLIETRDSLLKQINDLTENH